MISRLRETRTVAVAVAALAALVVTAWAGAGAAIGIPTKKTLFEGVDTRLCGFPLRVTVSAMGAVDPAAPEIGRFTLTGSNSVRIRNGQTGHAAVLHTTGSHSVDTRNGSVTFDGRQVWFWTTGGYVPFVVTTGEGQFLAPHDVLSPGRTRAQVVDPCSLVGPGPASKASPAVPSRARAPWPVPDYALSHIGYAGLVPLLGRVIRHDHVHLDVIVNGRKVKVPGGIGLAEPVDGGPCPQGPRSSGDCATGETIFAKVAVAPLHTHASSGLVHIESDRHDPYTLGQVFDEWGVRFDRRCVGGYCTRGGMELRVYVDGRRVTGDPRKVVLLERRQIAVVFGDDFSSVPSRYKGRWPGPGCGGPGEESCLPS